jgi:hypothetical protein
VTQVRIGACDPFGFVDQKAQLPVLEVDVDDEPEADRLRVLLGDAVSLPHRVHHPATAWISYSNGFQQCSQKGRYRLCALIRLQDEFHVMGRDGIGVPEPAGRAALHADEDVGVAPAQAQRAR